MTSKEKLTKLYNLREISLPWYLFKQYSSKIIVYSFCGVTQHTITSHKYYFSFNFIAGITRKQKMINSILQNVEMKSKAKEPCSVQCHSSKEETLTTQTSTVTAKSLHKDTSNKSADKTDVHEEPVIRINSGKTNCNMISDHRPCRHC